MVLTVLYWFPGNLGFGCPPYSASGVELCPALLSQAGICRKLWATAWGQGESQERENDKEMQEQNKSQWHWKNDSISIFRQSRKAICAGLCVLRQCEHDGETQGMGTGCLCPCAVTGCLFLFSLQPKVTEFLYHCQQDSELTTMQVLLFRSTRKYFL